MPNQDPLTQLKDIHLPEAISWWPLAPGWYVLIALGLCLITIITYQLFKKYAHALAKKQALKLLAHYQKQYQQEHNVPLSSAKVTELLRRVALVYFPREQVASLQGEAWLQFLNQTGKGTNFNSVRKQLLEAPFQADNNIDLKPLFQQAQQWIKQRRKPCSN